MKIYKFVIILLLSFLITHSFGQNKQITVICTNDLHGAIEPQVLDWADGNLVGGITYLAGYANAIKQENPDGCLLLDAGDVFQGTFISYAFKGQSVIECYNAMGYDAIAVGNHEFDWGVDVLVDRIAESDCPFLSANIVYKENGQLVSWAKPYTIFTRKGINIGVIGLTAEDTYTSTNPINVTEFDFTSAVDAANQYADSVEDHGASLIILLAHIGGNQYDYGEIGEIASQLDSNRFDLIVAGHRHSRLDDVINGIPVLANYSNSTAIGRIDIFVDPISGEVVDFIMNNQPTTTYHTYNGQPAMYNGSEVEPDPLVDQVYQSYKSQLDTIQNKIVGYASVEIDYANGPEWPIGNLITDAVRACDDLPEGVQQIDFAMTNNGGIRTNIPEGPITLGKVFQVFPFDNFLVILPVTGQQHKDYIENMVGGYSAPSQISGFSFKYNPDEPFGNRVNINDIIYGKTGEPIHIDSTYYLAVSDYMYNVDMLLQTFERIDSKNLYRDLILQYLEENSPVSPTVEGRIGLVTSLREKQGAPDSYRLFQNYPNPFNSKTMISYQLAMNSDVQLSIYNLLGQKVATLVNKKQAAGSYQVQWDASGFTSGIYIYQLRIGNANFVKKLVLLK